MLWCSAAASRRSGTAGRSCRRGRSLGPSCSRGQQATSHLSTILGHSRVRLDVVKLLRHSLAAGVASLAGTGPPPTASVSLR
jgi:hypothetical protein